MPTEQTPQLILFNIILIAILFLVTKRVFIKPYRLSKQHYKFAVFLCLIFCLFSFWGSDWFHYIAFYEDMKKGRDTHLEDIYYFIANITPNYIIFRLVIWGTGLFLFIDIIKRLSISKELAVAIFGCLYLIWYSYARASLAMVMAYYGYSLILKPYRNKRFSTIIGFVTIFVSFYFHKSSLFAIATIMLCLFIRRYPTKAVFFILITYPFVILLAKYQLADIMASDFDSSESDLNSYVNVGQRYLDAKLKTKGIGAFLMDRLETIPYYIVAFISFLALKRYKNLIPKDVSAFMTLLILLLIISTVFMFDLGFNTRLVYGRFMKFLAIPCSIVMAYLYQNKIYPKLTKVALIIGLLGTAYSMSYSFYCSIVGG